MKKTWIGLGLAVVLLWTLLLNVYHAGVLTPPRIPAGEQGSGEFIPRAQAGLNHLILRGTPYTRGLEAGRLTKDLLAQQEQVLVGQLRQWIPQTWLLKLGVAGLIAYFYGADEYIRPDDLLEMYGTTQSASREFNFLADPYTRQLAYHGLHEVGQMMVDRGVDMGCTVAAVPHGKNWIVGRNFDFEGGRIFDEEKIVKWVFPDQGLAHVSVIWAGMVGAVTGVNEKGLYASINAAGSKGYRRLGTPSTLVLYRILREAASVDEAVKILGESKMFITDIFVIGDGAGQLVKVEKSPQKMEVIPANGAFAVANHLTGTSLKHDPVNMTRMREQTSIARESRALSLASKIGKNATPAVKTAQMLELLRDKGADEKGKPLHFGNRQAIDALIATHAVIWDSARGILFVSQGPSLAGKFLGYDLAKSFKTGKPVAAGELPVDSKITAEFHKGHHEAMATIKAAGKLLRGKKCQEASDKLYSIPEDQRRIARFFHVLGDIQQCLNLPDRAELAWSEAYDMRPAYAAERRDLATKLRITLDRL